jgi:hypothetical protein
MPPHPTGAVAPPGAAAVALAAARPGLAFTASSRVVRHRPGLVDVVAAPLPEAARVVEEFTREAIPPTEVLLTSRWGFALRASGLRFARWRVAAYAAAPVMWARAAHLYAIALHLPEHVHIVLNAEALSDGGLGEIDATVAHELVHAVQFGRPTSKRPRAGRVPGRHRAPEEREAAEAEPALMRLLGHDAQTPTLPATDRMQKTRHQRSQP